MSSHFDNVVYDASLESSDIEEDSNTEEEYTQRTTRRPQNHRTTVKDAIPPSTRQDLEISSPMPLQPQLRPTLPKTANLRTKPELTTSRTTNQGRYRGSVILDRIMGIQKWELVILVVALCASLCHTLAFSTGSWMHRGTTHIGLWMDCNCTSYTPGGDAMKWLTSSKVFLALALLITLGVALTIPVYTALEVTSKRTTLAELLYKAADVTIVLTLIGFLPVGLLLDIDYDLGVGFGVCVVVALLCVPKHALLAVRDQEDFYNKFNWPHTIIVLCYLVAAHFLLACYSISSWATRGDTHVGLWKNCVCGGDTFSNNELTNTFKAVQAMITVGEILLLVNLFILAVLAGLPVTNPKRTLLITSMYIICFVAGITTVIADVMFATKILEGYTLSFSFIFSILSAAFCIIASCIAVLRRSSERSQTTPMSAA